MKCSRSERELSAFLDNQPDGEPSHLTARHIEDCPECRTKLHDLARMDELVRGLPRIDPSVGFASRVVRSAPASAGAGHLSFSSRLELAFAGFFEAIFSLFDGQGPPNARTLDEFGDFPPLSMSCIYFKLLDRSGC